MHHHSHWAMYPQFARYGFYFAGQMNNIELNEKHRGKILFPQLANDKYRGIFFYKSQVILFWELFYMKPFSYFQRELDLCRLKHEITLSLLSSICKLWIYLKGKWKISNSFCTACAPVVITVKGVSTHPSSVHPLYFLLKSSSSHHSNSENRVSFETEVSQLKCDKSIGMIHTS